MCFNIHKDNREPYTAQHDITCYKVMFIKKDRDTRVPIPNTYTSHVRSFTYEKGQTYTTEIERTKQWNYDSLLPIALQSPTLKLFSNVDTIDKGFHSFTTLDEALRNVDNFVEPQSTRIVNCRIPKGATYYFNPDDEQYVSSQITIVDDFQPSDEFRRIFIKGDKKSQDQASRLDFGFKGFAGSKPYFGIAIDPINLDDSTQNAIIFKMEIQEWDEIRAVKPVNLVLHGEAGTGKKGWAESARQSQGRGGRKPGAGVARIIDETDYEKIQEILKGKTTPLTDEQQGSDLAQLG